MLDLLSRSDQASVAAQRPYLFASSEACWWGPTPVAVLSTVQ